MKERAAVFVFALVGAACPRVDFSKLSFGSDAGAPDAGAESMSCAESLNEAGGLESVWCIDATTAELDALAEERDLQIIDLHIEPIEGERRVAAVLVPYAGLERSWSWELERALDEEGVVYYPEIDGRRAVSFSTYTPPDGVSALAAAFNPEAYGCSWYYGRPLADRDSIRRFFSDNRIRQQVIDLDPYFLSGYERRYLITRGAGGSTVALGAGSEAIDALIRDNPNSVMRAFHSTAIAGQYDVAIGPLAAGEAPSLWVRDLDPAELADLTARMRDRHPAKLDSATIDGTKRLAALFVPNTPATSRVADSRTFAASMASVVPTATVGIYLKEYNGDVLLAHNERHAILAEHLVAPLIALHALALADEARTTERLDDQLIDVPARGCETSTVIARRETIGQAVAGMLGQRDTARAKALIDHYGLDALRARATQISMRRTELDVVPGCDRPEAANTTTLLDQALLHEIATHCMMRFAYSVQLRAWMPGAEGLNDYEGFDATLNRVIDEQTIPALDDAQRARFKFEAHALYTASDLSEGSTIRRAVAGRLRVPFCTRDTMNRPELEHDLYFFGFFVEGPGDPAAVQHLFSELQRFLSFGPVRDSLRGGTDCF